MKDRNFYLREDRDDNKVDYKMKLLEYKSVNQHDLEKCTGCGICVIICPKEAIERTESDEHVDIPEIEKCSFCGVCDHMCPFGAWTLLINDEHKIQLKETPGNLPDLLGDELTCPRTNKPVKKYLEGHIKIDPKKCPTDCKKCVDACMMDVIEFTSLDANRQVKLNENQCIYCTACTFACPEPEALEVIRIGIKFDSSELRSSSIFNEVVRKLISQEAVAKIVKEQAQKVARDTGVKLFSLKV
ncbi:MAG: 4Fe-4S dicluster domain-containing protein [Candidatus Helarchaeota archaeon]